MTRNTFIVYLRRIFFEFLFAKLGCFVVSLFLSPQRVGCERKFDPQPSFVRTVLMNLPQRPLQSSKIHVFLFLLCKNYDSNKSENLWPRQEQEANSLDTGRR